jgi:hypothetical protein
LETTLTNLIEDQKQLKGLLKSCEFITKISNSFYKPNMRMYKFGSILNFKYTEIQCKYEGLFFKKLALILKSGILKLNSCCSNPQNQIRMRVLELYEEVMNRVLRESDVGWMKLHLDLKLK